jgi:hypothetical protein
MKIEKATELQVINVNRILESFDVNDVDKFYDEFKMVSDTEKAMLMGVLINSQYDYDEDAEKDEKQNALILSFLRDKRFSDVQKFILGAIGDGNKALRDLYWSNYNMVERK